MPKLYAIRFALFMLFLPLLTTAQSYSGPESVEYDPASGDYFISNTTTRQILRRSSNGTLTIFKTTNPAPYGIDIVGNMLYACVGGRVIGYDLSNAAEVFNLNLNATFLNGITADPNGNLFVTDFSGKKIYKVYVQSNTFTQFVTNTVTTPNGIVYDGANNRLVVAGWGSNATIKAVNLADSTMTTLVTTTFSNIDGIVHDGNGKFFVASWGADAVHSYESNFTVGPTLVQGNITNPADIDYNEIGDTLAVTSTTNNQLFLIPMGSSVGVEEQQATRLQCFPNPAMDMVYIPYEGMTAPKILVFDIMGRENQCPFIFADNLLSLDVANLAAGKYMVLVDGKTAVFVK